MRKLIPFLLLTAALTLTACNATPQSRCQGAAQKCLDNWDDTDINNCIVEWEIRVNEAADAGCSREFQEWFNCVEQYSQCYDEERSDGSYTLWGLRDSDTVCDDEATAYFTVCR